MPIYLSLRKTLNMDTKETDLKQLKKNLYPGDDSRQIREIKMLRNKKAIPGAILLLLDIFEKTQNEEVKKEIENFLNDLNNQNSIEEVIRAIDKAGREHTKKVFISSCWQSGLDYSSYIHRFIEYSIKLDYLSAIECYSVIEEWSGSAASEDTRVWIKMINESLDDQSDEKKTLLKAIITVLQ